ncbi:MAG: BatA domain-containing protein [Pirellula sp.]|jgi:hypothetical protein|nr:BatA domain-containing protein [Pirellula sp.]
MSFLQPWMLLALPLAAIPIVIHLVNQRRFQTVPWAAMRFLLEANRMSSGYTRLRQWLILAMRTLAVLALVLFTARPLTSGIMALLNGESGTQAIVILDRSPSMGDRLPNSNRTRLESAIDQLSSTFQTLGIQRIIQLDEATGKPEEFASLNQWLRAVPRTPWSATSDIPGLLEQALVYAKNNPVGNSVVWIGSDLREADWRSRDGRWAAVRDGFKSLPQNIRFSVLDLSSDRTEDRSIRVTNAQCIDNSETPTLSISFRIDRTSGSDAVSIPVEIAIGNSRTSLDVNASASGAQVNDYRLPLPAVDGSATEGIRGWGWVKIPSDGNPSNDISYFAFEQPPLRRTVIVSNTPDLVAAIELCASIAPQQTIRCESELVTPSQLPSVPLDGVALLVWNDDLPTGDLLEIVQSFVHSGGQVLLVPPENPNDNVAFGFQWKEWKDVGGVARGTPTGVDEDAASNTRISQWQNDSELLANTLNGAPLPLGQLSIRRLCAFDGRATALASMADGQPILAVLENDGPRETAGSMVICATTPSDRDSTLAGDGVVLYVAIQRMLAAGARRAATIKQGVAGVNRDWVQATSLLIAGDEAATTTEYAMHAGIYDSNKSLVALDRGLREDESSTVDESALGTMFGELNWARVGVEGRSNGIIQEIWRWFVILMLAALILEALLCLPRLRRGPVLPSTHRS